MMSRYFQTILAVLFATAMSAMISQEEQKPLEENSVIIRSATNGSLCIRTEAYTYEGAIMRLADCERIYENYDGEKVHRLVNESEIVPGFQIDTVWEPLDVLAIRGCLYPHATEIRVTANCDKDSILRSWDFFPISGSNDIGILKNLGEETCMRAPEIEDRITLKMANCDMNDINQQWVLDNLTDFKNEIKSAFFDFDFSVGY